MSGLDRRFKIRNEYFVKKINKICNSNEYLEALERKHRNKINEIKLIEYIKDILEEMVIYLIQFKVRKQLDFLRVKQVKQYVKLNFIDRKQMKGVVFINNLMIKDNIQIQSPIQPKEI